jgi:hypothetical protein
MLKETLDNLKNKIEYKIHTLAYDPVANEYARENKIRRQPEGLTSNKDANVPTDKQQGGGGDKKDIADSINTDIAKSAITDTSAQIKAATDTDDPDKFSFKRFMKRFWEGFMKAIKMGIIPFFALMMSMIVANDLIVYPVPLRIIGFVFSLIANMINPIVIIVLVVYYMGIGAYGYIQNRKLPADKKLTYLPHIFALLPVLIQNDDPKEPPSKLMKILSYPFKYPKTAENAAQLPKIMQQYLAENEASFADFDAYKGREPFAAVYNDLKQSILSLHEPSQKNSEIVTGAETVTGTETVTETK